MWFQNKTLEIERPTVQWIDLYQTEGCMNQLKGFGPQVKKYIHSKGGNISLKGKTGDFWDPVKLYGIYYAIEKYFPRIDGPITQIAGGVSPLLFVLQSQHPETVERVVAYDIDPYFKKNFEDLFDYKFITGDAAQMSHTKYKPSISFSYHFLIGCILIKGNLEQEKPN